MEIIARHRARFPRTELRHTHRTAFAVMSVIGAVVALMTWGVGLPTIDWVIVGALYFLGASVLPAGLALVSARAPGLAARRLAPLVIPIVLLWAAVLTIPVWYLLLWPLSLLGLAGVALVALWIGAILADIGTELLVANRRYALDWVAGLALVLPVVGVVLAVAWFAIKVWGQP